MFSSDKMDIHAAEKFWNEFSGKEEWIINGLSKNPLTVVDFVDVIVFCHRVAILQVPPP